MLAPRDEAGGRHGARSTGDSDVAVNPYDHPGVHPAATGPAGTVPAVPEPPDLGDAAVAVVAVAAALARYLVDVRARAARRAVRRFPPMHALGRLALPGAVARRVGSAAGSLARAG